MHSLNIFFKNAGLPPRKQMGEVFRPLNVIEVIHKINNLIKKQDLQDAVAEFQKVTHL